MRFAVPFLLGMLLGACAGHGSGVAPASNLSRSDAASDLTSETVAIVTSNETSLEPHAKCTGVWVAPRAILTALHCIKSEEAIDGVRVFTTNDLLAAPRIGQLADYVAADELHDMALLYVPDTFPHGVAVTCSNSPAQGDFVQTMGHAKGLWWTYSTGYVSAIRFSDLTDHNGPQFWIQATAPISPGSSGGGLFAESGCLLGIAHGIVADGNSLGFFTYTNDVRAFLATAKPWMGR